MDPYLKFIKSKSRASAPSGFDVSLVALNPAMKPFQKIIVRWALRGGKRAIFSNTGTGKTLMELEWANQVSMHHGRVLLLTPLAVAEQTEREAVKFGIHGARVVSAPSNDRIQITNYEKIHKFDPTSFCGIVLDESSVLKAMDSTYRKLLTEFSRRIPFRLPCSATPAPNDFMELGSHAEYLGVMSSTEMLAMFFTHDGGDTSKWRLKGHAASKFWSWVASWAVAIRKPSDIGCDDSGYDLPTLHMHQHTIESGVIHNDKLFMVEAETLQERQAARRETVGVRVTEAARLANESGEPWIIWCGRNAESEECAKTIRGSVNVTGSDSAEFKRDMLLGFVNGDFRVLITKPEIAGLGLNFQHCRNMAFVGLSDSWEQFYQSVRRCWRFGQEREVHAHIITTDIEGAVVRNIERKERQAEEMLNGMVEHMKTEMDKNLGATVEEKSEYKRDKVESENFIVHLGDCVEVLREMPDDSIHYSVFSPPFASLYTYSNSDLDMGNCRDYDEFVDQFKFLVEELYRVIIPGRNLSFHCMNLPLTKERDGVIGLRDFRGELIRLFQDAGFIFHSEVCIWKDPVTAMQRTKAIGLLYKQLRKDSTISRQGIPDYLVTMRKPGVNPERVTKTHQSFPVSEWQEYASPVWMNIDQSKTLSRDGTREEEDERHICALQLDVIERAIRLWSNEGDTILSPFMGIGSEGYQAIKMGRRFVGCELKESYWKVAVKNLKQVEHDAGEQQSLFAECAAE